MRKKKRKKHTKTITKIVLFSGILIGGGIGIVTIMNCNVPEKRLMEYMKYIEKGEYEQMYAMLDQKKRTTLNLLIFEITLLVSYNHKHIQTTHSLLADYYSRKRNKSLY